LAIEQRNWSKKRLCVEGGKELLGSEECRIAAVQVESWVNSTERERTREKALLRAEKSGKKNGVTVRQKTFTENTPLQN